MSWFSGQKDMNPESDPIQIGEYVVVDDIDGGHAEEVVDLTVDGLPVVEDGTGNRGYVPEKRIRGKVRW